MLDPDGLDVARAQSLLTRGPRDSGRATRRRADAAARGLALWRGPALADLTDVAALATMAVGFEQLRREVTDLLIGCALDAGQADGVVRLAAEALAADPLREPAVLLLMRALAVTGQAPRGAARRRASTGAGWPRRRAWTRRRSSASSNAASPSGTIGPVGAGADVRPVRGRRSAATARPGRPG